MRIIKIARYFDGIKVMLEKTRKSLAEIGPFTLLLFFFIYLFSLLGRELFAYKARIGSDDEFIYGEDAFKDLRPGEQIRYPRINFNSLGDSMTTVFILINGGDWVEVANDWIRAYGSGDGMNELVATIYFVVVMIFGNMTLFTLFTGILLHNFKELEETKSAEKQTRSKTFFKHVRQAT